MPRALAALSVCLLANAGCRADDLSCDFEHGLPPGAQVNGDVKVDREAAHTGRNGVRIGRGGELVWPVNANDGFGTVTMWVFDSGLTLEGEQAKTRLFGPLWGLTNRGDERLCFGLLYAPYLDGNGSYGWISTAEGGWGSRRYARSARSKGWHEWVVTVNNETAITVTVDGKEATGFDTITSRFFKGFSGIYLRGAQDLDEPLLVDDVQVAWQAAVLTPRTEPLPGEKRKPPDLEPLRLLPAVEGKHPRLFFTADDVAGIRDRCKTTHADFLQRLLGGADSYLHQMPPANESECANDQVMQQWAWWRLQTLAFAYVTTGNEEYGRKAVEWMTIFAGYRDWGAGEEMNQSMGAANMLTGMACAYDWCYDLLTDDQRTLFRDKLLRQVGELCWKGFLDPNTAGYWKQDYQNNHRHHRLSGLLLGSLAIAGEVPEAASYAAFGAADLAKVADALPPDGSNHEGPSYMSFGFSYVIRCLEALRHCTGIDLFNSPGLANMPLFRAHMLTPGFQGVFNFGDGGDGTYYFNHYLFRLASEYQDGAAQALMKAAYDASPDSFTYLPWDILWYDADLAPTPLDRIPTWHYFDDLEIATYRTSWTDPNALAVLFKCGPYGGHRMNELAQGWVNIAHDHPDANHFMLFWRGHMWATDDGYPKRHKAGENHNLVLVDGKGPLQRGEGWLQPIDGMAGMGRIDQVTTADGLFAVRGDASKYYPMVQRASRWLAVVNDRYVLVLDDLAADQPHDYQWLLHTPAAVAPAEGGYDLSLDAETLHLRIALPAGWQGQVEKDELEGKERGRLVRVTPADPVTATLFLAVMAVDDVPAVTAEESAEAVVVHLGGTTLRFDRASGEVAREAGG